MGDADGAAHILRNSELETVVEDELMEIEEQMGRLFTYINSLKIQTSLMMSQMASYQKFRRCFIALNLFVVPILLAIWITFMTAGMLTSESIIRTVIDAFLMILMYMSTIGLLLYFYTLFEAYFSEDDAQDISDMLNELASNMANGSELILPTTEAREDYGYIRTFSNMQMQHTSHAPSVRENRNHREEQEEGVSPEINAFTTALLEMLTVYTNEEMKSADQKQLLDMTFEYCVEDSDTSCTEMSEIEQDEDMQLINVNSCENPSMDIDKNYVTKGIVPEALNGRLLKTENTQGRNIRTITIQNNGNGNIL